MTMEMIIFVVEVVLFQESEFAICDTSGRATRGTCGTS